MIKYIKRALILWLFYNSFTAISQQDDARLWLKAGIEKKFSQKLSLELEACTRIGENYSRMESYFGSLGLNYKIRKHFKCGVAYRHSAKREITPFFFERNRGSVWFSYKNKLYKRLYFENRLLYQKQYSAMTTSEKGYLPSNYLRNKLELLLNLKKKYSPYVATELYYQVKYQKSEINRVRYTLGCNYNFDKHHKISIYYMIQREINEPDPVRSYITALEYKYTF
jgi:hypothetical protein